MSLDIFDDKISDYGESMSLKKSIFLTPLPPCHTLSSFVLDPLPLVPNSDNSGLEISRNLM